MSESELYKETKTQEKNRADSWANIITGLGYLSTDKKQNTKFVASNILQRETLLNIFRADGLGKKIVSIPADDMVREWIDIEGDPGGLVDKYMQDLQVKKAIKEALTWSRLFGGAVIVLGVNDGKDLSEPVVEDQIQDVESLVVFDRHDVQWTSDDLYSDPEKPKFGLPEIYHITNQTTSSKLVVHESRIIRFDGELLPTMERMHNQSWGDSVLQSIYDRLNGVGEGIIGIDNILTDFTVGTLKIANLQQMLAQKNGTELVRARMQAIDMVKHIMNTIVMDKNEEYERLSVSASSGLSDLISISIDVLCGVSGIPRVKLIGDQTKGLGSEAAGNIRLYYDEIASKQEDVLLQPIKKIAKYIFLSKNGPFKGVEPESWGVVFNPLWQPTEKEDEEVRKLVADRDNIYLQMGLPPEVIISSRFGGDTYSRETVLPEAYKDQLQQFIDAGDFLIEEEQKEIEEPEEDMEK